jgi:hypothetical protein
MDWHDYLRAEVQKYRKLADQAKNPSIKQELLELADVCDKVAADIEGRMTPDKNARSSALATISNANEIRDRCQDCCDASFSVVDLHEDLDRSTREGQRKKGGAMLFSRSGARRLVADPGFPDVVEAQMLLTAPPSLANQRRRRLPDCSPSEPTGQINLIA